MVRSFVLTCIRSLPRGGARVARLLAGWLPSLRDVRVQLAMPPGATIRADLRESIFFPLFKHGCYPHQIAEDRAALALIRAGDTVWDVGANIGYTALIYESAVGAGGRVLAFEPSRKAFAYLQRTVEGRARIRTFALAIGDREGEVLFREEDLLDRSAVIDGERTDRDFVVPSARIDDLVYRDGLPAPQFLKIDVEGHELAVFDGARQLIARDRPLIEFEALTRELRNRIVALLDEASGGEYRYFGFELETGRLLPLASLADTAGTCNFLAATHAHDQRLRAALGA